MKFGKLYQFVVREGIEADPRGKKAVQRELEKVKISYRDLSEDEKKEFDQEKLNNPYNDTRILYGQTDTEVRSVLAGIDIDVGEILLADRLRERGDEIDLIISHHPGGKALAGLYEVMGMQADILSRVGVPITVAEGSLSERIREVERKLMPINHTRAQDVAALLDIPFMCVHTPADNHVAGFLQKLLDAKKPDTVEEVIKILKSIPEYADASRRNAGPKVVSGETGRRAGKIFVDMTGGTEGAKDIFERLIQAGVGTVVGMHISEEHLKNVKQNNLNIVVAGHIASDTLGLNLLLDKVIKKEPSFKIVACSGFRRIRRKT